MKQIAKALGVSPGSVHRWCHDIELTPEQRDQIDNNARAPQSRALRRSNKKRQALRKALRTKQRRMGADRLGNGTGRDLLMLGLGLYWGEGSKREPGDLSMSNMDPRIHEVFLKWLRGFGLRNQDLTIRLCIAPGYDVEKHLRWWKRRLNLSRLKNERTWVVLPSSSKRRIRRQDYHGTLTIGTRNADLWYEIMGMLDAAPLAGFEPASLE